MTRCKSENAIQLSKRGNVSRAYKRRDGIVKNMKIVSSSSLVLCVILFCAAITANAQEKAVDSKEYYLMQQSSFIALYRQAHRSTTTKGRDFKDGVPKYTDVKTVEFVPPDRWRTVSVITSAEGTLRTEEITIGKMVFNRKNEEPWTVGRFGAGSGSGVGSGPGYERGVERIVEYKLIAGEKIGGEDVRLYQQKVVLKSGEEVRDTKIEREWYDKEGLLLRSEHTSADGTGKIYRRSVSVYEYDPKIKIEAPVF